ncbi:hypothetical protein AAG570_003689 [Ranatra chinensis]|uniref:SANT and BTB domain-containing protein n=1 Tax=Ranatra chinensis TaxID=642074 RepID=A0ABD0Y6M4_9HEMI
MASKRRNIFQKNKTHETTENGEDPAKTEVNKPVEEGGSEASGDKPCGGTGGVSCVVTKCFKGVRGRPKEKLLVVTSNRPLPLFPQEEEKLRARLAGTYEAHFVNWLVPNLLWELNKGGDLGANDLVAGPLSARKETKLNQNLLKNDIIVIHVKDDQSQLTKDYELTQKVIMKQMGYFPAIICKCLSSPEGHGIEDIDITITCSLGIFEWIMNWMKTEPTGTHSWPLPDPAKIVPLLISAEFLKIDLLVEYCTSFMKHFMTEVIAASPDMSGLSEYVVCRLADMYTNMELEELVDKEDKIRSRLFRKFTLFLMQARPDVSRGHFSSLCSVYRCARCAKLVHSELASFMSCLPKCSKLNPKGVIVGTHIRDKSWNINNHLAEVKRESNSWRKLYWRLWGDCHFLLCKRCDNFFPISQTNWCLQHTDEPQYFVIDGQPSPIGCYGCCGTKAYRFEVLPNPMGCEYKKHEICGGTKTIDQVVEIAEKLAPTVWANPPPIRKRPQEKIIKLIRGDRGIKEDYWWEGLEICPPKKSTRHLLNKIPQIPKPRDGASQAVKALSKKNTEGEPGQEKPNKMPQNYRGWKAFFSKRINQDNQKLNEEKLMQKISDQLAFRHKRRGALCMARNSQSFLGGSFVEAEDEWRTKLAKQKAIQPNPTVKPKSEQDPPKKDTIRVARTSTIKRF